jgi:hypothetical protein
VLEPRLSSADIHWVTAPAEPRMTARDWRNADRRVRDNLAAIDRRLSAWAGFEPKTVAVDHLLDERLMLRPPDVMATRPAAPARVVRPSVPVIPGRSS